jgi:Transposase C of IS166 homeodomain
MQDPELVKQLKENLPEALFERLNGSLSIDRDRLRFAEYKVRVLEERLRLVRIEKYGPGSEKLSEAQLELLELEPGVSSAEVEAESQRDQLQLPLKAARNHPGRQQLPAELPRTEQVIACTAAQCVCGKCGKQTTVIGYETSEQLDVEKGPNDFWVTSRASSKVTVMELTIMWAEPESCTQPAGHMPGESSSRPLKSIPKIRARSGSWRRWMNFLLSTAKHGSKV